MLFFFFQAEDGIRDRDVTGVQTCALPILVVGDEAPLAGVPNLALRAERAPNGRGAELLGYGRSYAAALTTAQSAAVVLVLDDPDAVVKTDGALIYLGTVLPPAAREAAVALPIANVAEEEGTFVNRDGRVQRYFQAKPAPGMARPAWWVLGELLPEAERPASAADAFAQLAAAEPAFAGLTYDALGFTGRRVADGRAAASAAGVSA